MQKIYKAYFLQQLRILIAAKVLQIEDAALVEQCIQQAGFKPWNVYAKKPFGGPLQVLNYLGRYTHKIAITSSRIEAIDEVQQTIRFKYNNYHARATNKERQIMTLPINEFIRRYEQHILPKGFVKIRHYGYLKNYKRTERLKQLFAMMQLPPPPPKVQVPVKVRMLEKHGLDITLCSVCKTGTMQTVATFYKGVLCNPNGSKSMKPILYNADRGSPTLKV